MNTDREKYILEQLLAKKKVWVKELAAELFASEPSIRRDLTSLENQKLLKRIHGGAILSETALSELKIPFAIREFEQIDAKLIIAKKASELVHDDDVVFIDASSSAYALIPFLATKKNLTVITGGIRALQKLAEYNINTICTGGKLINSCLSLVGEEAYEIIEGINADVLFFSCRGLSENGKLTDISDTENNVRKKMLAHSDKSYLLCASEKIGKIYYHNLCTADTLTGVVTEKDNLNYGWKCEML